MKISARLKEDLKRYLLRRRLEEAEKVTIVSAYKLSAKEVENIKKRIPDIKKSEVHVEVDESLMAGVLVQKGSKIIDLTLRGRMQSLEKSIYEFA